MPHVSIKHFPAPLDSQQQAELVERLTAAVTGAFGCDEGVVSIALEAVDAGAWHEQVYVPEVVNGRDRLCKIPNY
jgi:4-oxalocrotonate tautomerase